MTFSPPKFLFSPKTGENSRNLNCCSALQLQDETKVLNKVQVESEVENMMSAQTETLVGAKKIIFFPAVNTLLPLGLHHVDVGRAANQDAGTLRMLRWT